MSNLYAELLKSMAFAADKKQNEISKASKVSPTVISAYFGGKRIPKHERFEEIIKSVGYDYEIVIQGKEVVLRLKPTTEAG